MGKLTRQTVDSLKPSRVGVKGSYFFRLFLASDESSYITGTDIVVDDGWFSAAPYLTNERSHHMLQLLNAKDKNVLEEFLKHFR